MAKFIITVFMTLSLAGFAMGKGEKAGEFDYYMLTLSWSPSWCAREGNKRNAEQCRVEKKDRFILHGLWPQYEQGWPSFCVTPYPNPNKRQTSEMVDIQGSSGLAWHQWRKHGVCSGLNSSTYFSLSRKAYATINIPAHWDRPVSNTPIKVDVLVEDFSKANQNMSHENFTIQCKKNPRDGLLYFTEIRVCIDKDLTSRNCTGTANTMCPASSVIFPMAD